MSQPLKKEGLLSSPLLRLIRQHGKPERKKLIGASIGLLITASATALVAAQLKPIFDDIFIGHKRELLFYVASGMLGLFIIKGISEFFAHRWLDQAGQGFMASLQQQLFAHMLSLDVSYFHTHSSGHLMTLMTQDVLVTKNAFLTTLISMARESVTALGLLCLMVKENCLLSLVSLFVLPLVGLLLFICGRKVKKLSARLFEDTASIHSFFQQAFDNITVIKSHQTEQVEWEALTHSLTQQKKHAQRLTTLRSLVHPVVEVIGGLAIMLVIFYGGYQVIAGTKTTGSFLAFLLALIFIYRPLKAIVQLHSHLQEGQAAASRIHKVLQQKPHSHTTNGISVRPPLQQAPEIVFSNVTFAYGDQPILRNFSLTIPAGKKIALVGPSGSGKTTLFHLLLRFYDPQEGHILLNGQDIRAFSLHDLRQTMTLVSQDIGLFDKTIAQNIAYGQKDVHDARIQRAAALASADEFIQILPKGYHTVLGVRGGGLSGGQKQRLTLARAFLRPSPILLLDEVSSALDGQCEQKIFASLAQLGQTKTLLLISHRLSMLEDMDGIAVMDKGQLVAYGSHQELMNQEGLYHNLVLLQKILHRVDSIESMGKK